MGKRLLEIIEEEQNERKHQKSRPIKIDILFEDNHILVINKPAGLDSVRGMYSTISVLDYLEEKFSDTLLRVIHRLDRDTSGVMVLAKTEIAQKELVKQWQESNIEKIYLALVQGYVYPKNDVIDLPLIKTEKRSKPVVVDEKRGKQAITEYTLLEQFREYALVQAKLITGKMHQIRVHFASRGFPVLCDRHYGFKQALFLSDFKRGYKISRRKVQRPLIARLALHSHKLSFNHPQTAKRISFEADLPRDFSAALHQLKKFG